jgi:hypothetical protein
MKKKIYYDKDSGIIDLVPWNEIDINFSDASRPFIEMEESEWYGNFGTSLSYTVFCYKDGKIISIPDPNHLAEYNNDRKEDRKSTLHYYLDNTDYVISKLQEISLTGTAQEFADAKEKYSDILAKRKAAREELATLDA